MLTSTVLITSLSLFFSSASAGTITKYDSQAPILTVYTDGDNCNGTTMRSWELNADSTDAQCFNYQESAAQAAQEGFNGTVYSGMGSAFFSNLPAGKCLLVQMSNDASCPFQNSLAFPFDHNPRPDGCYSPNSFNSSDSEVGRAFFNIAVTMTNC